MFVATVTTLGMPGVTPVAISPNSTAAGELASRQGIGRAKAVVRDLGNRDGVGLVAAQSVCTSSPLHLNTRLQAGGAGAAVAEEGEGEEAAEEVDSSSGEEEGGAVTRGMVRGHLAKAAQELHGAGQLGHMDVDLQMQQLQQLFTSQPPPQLPLSYQQQQVLRPQGPQSQPHLQGRGSSSPNLSQLQTLYRAASGSLAAGQAGSSQAAGNAPSLRLNSSRAEQQLTRVVSEGGPGAVSAQLP
ncbi:hypothetical protein HaLaN_08105, partial [Haematococcus lacustris]